MNVIAVMDAIKHLLLTFASLLIATQGTFGQTDRKSAEEKVAERITAFTEKADKEAPDLARRAWIEWQEGEADQETTALLQYKIAWAANKWPEQVPEEVAEWLQGEWPSDLDLGASKISMRLGGYFFHQSAYEQALKAFSLSESTSQDLETKTRALENIAVCYVQLEDLAEAIRYFEIAMTLREGQPNSLTVSNLAGIYNDLGNPEQALTTLDMVDWDTEVGPVKRMALINKLSALRLLPEREEDMESAYTNLTEQFPVPIYPQEVAEVVRTALVLNDTNHVLGIQTEIDAIVRDNRAFAQQWMPELMPLFGNDGEGGVPEFGDLPWQTRWKMARWLVLKNRESFVNMGLNQRAKELEADLSEALTSIEQSENRLWLVILVALGLTGLLGLTWWQRLQVSRLRRQVAEKGLALSPADFQAIEVIRDAITQGKNINTALVHLSNLNDLFNHQQPIVALKDTDDPLLKKLNNSELQLMDQILRGYSSKEISIIMNVSAGHIYNMRSMIREKLGLERDVDLHEWLKSRFAEAPQTK